MPNPQPDSEAEINYMLVTYGRKVIERGAGTPMNEEITEARHAIQAMLVRARIETLRQAKAYNRNAENKLIDILMDSYFDKRIAELNDTKEESNNG